MYKPYVYRITFIDPNNQEYLYYIGARYSKSKYNGIANPNDLWKTYFTSCSRVHELINMHGKESFSYKIIKTFNSKKECLDFESKYLKRINAKENDKFINKSNGGLTYYTHSLTEEHKQKISAAKKGRKFTEEHKEKLRKNHKGRKGKKHTEEWKLQSSKRNSGENNPMYGKTHSNDIKEKISAHSKKMWENIPLKTCPHCKTKGRGGSMTRWHFDNCKLKN